MPAEAIARIVDTLPGKPGVYLFKDVRGRTIYVGKARRIRDRVRSHLRGGWDERKQARMLEAAVDVEVIVTDSEVEALALENSLIKQNQPRFNILLRDDKNHPHLRLTESESFPRLQLVRGRARDRDSYFGPYIPASRARLTQILTYRNFGVRPCNIDIDGSWDRPCLYYDIGECAGPCVESLCDQPRYAEIVQEAKLFLNGRRADLAVDLESKMHQAASGQEYERAAHYRDLLDTVRESANEQKIAAKDLGDRDLFAFHRGGDCRDGAQSLESVQSPMSGKVALQIFLVRRGLVVERKQFFWDDVGEIDDTALLTTAVQQYYHGGTAIPAEVCIPMHLPDAEVLASWLRVERGGAVRLLIPQRGSKRRLLELVRQNAELAFNNRYLAGAAQRGAEALRDLLDLDSPPATIRCIDASNLQGSQIVASLVSFRDGRAEKSEYKRFRIRDLTGQDDVASIAQVVRRYFKRVRQGEIDAPDLLLIDGGRGQLGAAARELDELGMQQQPLAAIEKGEEKLYVMGRPAPIQLAPSPDALRLVQQVRDEAHRFAITYHRAVRSRNMLHSELDGIPGIGAKRRAALLRRFGSVRGVREAGIDQLKPVVGARLAVRLHDLFGADESGGTAAELMTIRPTTSPEPALSSESAHSEEPRGK